MSFSIDRFLISRLPPSVSRLILFLINRVRFRRTPKLRQPVGSSGRVLDCTVAYNRFGGYCVPNGSEHGYDVQAILRGRVYEPMTLSLMAEVAGGGDIVHAGAYFGDFLPALSRACAPGAVVWAFEPNDDSFRCAEITCLINGLTNTNIRRAALGASVGEVAMRSIDVIGRKMGGKSEVQIATGAHADSLVPMVTLDASIPPDREVAVIQLDLEGYEQHALAGALALVARCKPTLIIETLPDPQWIEEHLTPLGYRLVQNVHHNHVLRAS